MILAGVEEVCGLLLVVSAPRSISLLSQQLIDVGVLVVLRERAISTQSVLSRSATASADALGFAMATSRKAFMLLLIRIYIIGSGPRIRSPTPSVLRLRV